MDWTEDRREALAADYVLGLMQGRARARFERRMREDPALERSVWAWRERLDPLFDAAVVEPSPQVWRHIEAELGWQRAPRRGWSLFERLSLAAASLSLCAAIGLAVVVQTRPAVEGGRVLAVLQGQQQRPAFRITLAPDGRSVTVVAVRRLIVPADRSLELWALPKQGAPVAVGLLDAAAGQARRYVLRVPLAGLGGFAVSVEPPGGSPGPGPSGPVIYQGRIAPDAAA